MATIRFTFDIIILFHAIIRDGSGEFTILVYEKTNKCPGGGGHHEPYKCNITISYGRLAISRCLELVTLAATRSRWKFFGDLIGVYNYCAYTYYYILFLNVICVHRWREVYLITLKSCYYVSTWEAPAHRYYVRNILLCRQDG